jgi:hypothetical protein
MKLQLRWATVGPSNSDYILWFLRQKAHFELDLASDLESQGPGRRANTSSKPLHPLELKLPLSTEEARSYSGPVKFTVLIPETSRL